jgi:hypothetical protein
MRYPRLILLLLTVFTLPASAQDLELPLPSLKDLPGLLNRNNGTAKPAGPPPLAATPADLSCPGDITVEEELRVQVPKGWQNWSPDAATAPAERRRPLDGITFYSGPPADKASLAPDRSRRSKNGYEQSWRFGIGSYWMACRYQDSRILLMRPLPRGVRQCQLTLNQSERPAALTCR